MNKVIGGALLLLLVGWTGSNANAAAWCANYDISTRNCGFHTYEQCLATIRGAGGWCSPNTYERSQAGPYRGDQPYRTPYREPYREPYRGGWR